MTEQTGDEWGAWSGGTPGDKWKAKDNVGRLVRLRMKARKDLVTKYGPWEFIETDVDVIHEDGEGFDAYADVTLDGKWFLGTFSDHLPYTAFGVIESREFANGTGYAMRQMTKEERALADKALDAPGF